MIESEAVSAIEFLPHCRDCESTLIIRVRELLERQYIELDVSLGDTIVPMVDSEDTDCYGEWRWECERCGRSSEYLEYILALRPEDEDGDWEDEL